MLAGWAIAVAFTCACSSSDSGANTEVGGFVSSYCGTCCPAMGGNAATCESILPSAFSHGFDSAAATACLAQIAASSGYYCKPHTGGADQFFACDYLFKIGSGTPLGTTPPGGACKAADDCAPSYKAYAYCNTSMSTSICQLYTTGKQGDGPCLLTETGHQLAFVSTGDNPSTGFACLVRDGLYCDSASKTCQPVPAVGAACSSSTSYCQGGFCDTSSQKCLAPRDIGGDCGAEYETCVETAYCDSTAKKCAALLAAGTACTSSEQCASKHCHASVCEATTAALCGL